MASSDVTRVYITEAQQCPDDAVLREGKRGALYYIADHRGSHDAVGGPHENTLLETEFKDVDGDARLTPEEMAEICEPCAEKMRQSGIRELKLKNAPAEIFKPFGPYDDMDDCMSEHQDKDDPGAYCAQIHYEITGEWPQEKDEEKSMNGRIFVASDDEAPDGVQVKEDDAGRLYYEKQQAYENARAIYPVETEDEITEETDVDLPDSDGAGDGSPDETEFDEQLDDMRDSIHDVEDEEGLPVHTT